MGDNTRLHYWEQIFTLGVTFSFPVSFRVRSPLSSCDENDLFDLLDASKVKLARDEESEATACICSNLLECRSNMSE